MTLVALKKLFLV